MISCFIILISSLLLFPVRSANQPFYVINAGVIEECSAGSNIYLNKFDSTKMRCLVKTHRHVTINNEYSCEKNDFSRIWIVTTNSNQGSSWPKKVVFITPNGNMVDWIQHGPMNDNQHKQIISEDRTTFNPNDNQLITFIWTEPRGPQCRCKYTVVKDICAKNKQTVGAKCMFRNGIVEKKILFDLVNEFVCYYGIQDFNLNNKAQRDLLSKIIDGHIKSNSNTPQKNPSTSNKTNDSQKNPSTGNATNDSENGPDISALNGDNMTFWEKNQRNIFIGAGIGVFIILVVIILIIIKCKGSSNKDTERGMSVDSNLD